MAPTSSIVTCTGGDVLHGRIDLGKERFVDGLGDIDPLDGHTYLTGVVGGRPHCALGGRSQVGVLENDHRVVATEFKNDRYESLGRRDGHCAPVGGGTGEPHDIHRRSNQGLPRLPGSMHDSYQTLRQPGLGGELNTQLPTERGDL